MRARVLFVAAVAVGALVRPLIADCGDGTRQIPIMSTLYLETGDTWSGQLFAPLSICGGCQVSSDAPHSLKITVDWGDGASDKLDVANPQSSMKLQYDWSAGRLTGKHTYGRALADGTTMLVTVDGWCANPQRNWNERWNNVCGGNVANCVPHPAIVGVFDPVPPRAASINSPIIHGQSTLNALGIVLEGGAPQSGMRIQFASDTIGVNLIDKAGVSRQSGELLIPAAKTSWSFTIDATQSAATSQASIKLTSAGQAVTVSFPVK